MQNKSEKWFPKVVTNREIFFYLFFFKKSQVNVCGGNFPFPIFYLYFLNQVNVFAGNFPFFLSFFLFFFLFWHRKQAGCGFNACLLRPAGWLLIRIQESLLSVCVDTEISLSTAKNCNITRKYTQYRKTKFHSTHSYICQQLTQHYSNKYLHSHKKKSTEITDSMLKQAIIFNKKKLFKLLAFFVFWVWGGL